MANLEGQVLKTRRAALTPQSLKSVKRPEALTLGLCERGKKLQHWWQAWALCASSPEAEADTRAGNKNTSENRSHGFASLWMLMAFSSLVSERSRALFSVIVLRYQGQALWGCWQQSTGDMIWSWSWINRKPSDAQLSLVDRKLHSDTWSTSEKQHLIRFL